MRTLDRVQYKKGTKTYNGVVSEQDVELKVENNSISYSNDGVNYNKSLPILQGDTAPTTSTVGEIGQFYLDKTNVNVYQCFGTVQTPPSAPEYQWELMGGRAKQNILSSAIVMDGTIDKSLGFNSLGALVKGSASGGQKYRHDILIYRNGTGSYSKYRIQFVLETDSATPFSDEQTLKTYLATLSGYININGFYVENNSIYILLKMKYTSGNSIVGYYTNININSSLADSTITNSLSLGGVSESTLIGNNFTLFSVVDNVSAV